MLDWQSVERPEKWSDVGSTSSLGCSALAAAWRYSSPASMVTLILKRILYLSLKFAKFTTFWIRELRTFNLWSTATRRRSIVRESWSASSLWQLLKAAQCLRCAHKAFVREMLILVKPSKELLDVIAWKNRSTWCISWRRPGHFLGGAGYRCVIAWMYGQTLAWRPVAPLPGHWATSFSHFFPVCLSTCLDGVY